MHIVMASAAGGGRVLAATSPTGAERIVMPPATAAAATMAAKAFNTKGPYFSSTEGPLRRGLAGDRSQQPEKRFKPQRHGLAGYRGAG